MKTFAEMTTRAQVAHLRPIGWEACCAFGLRDAQLTLINHAFNTTWRVTAGGEEFALRLNVNSARTTEEIRGEVAWTQALAAETDLIVPAPLGMAEFRSPLIDKSLPAVLYRWLPGRHLKNRVSAPTMAKVGVMMRTLHQHAAGFTFPEGASRPLLRNVLEGVIWRLPNEAVFLDSLAEANAALEKAKHGPARPVHFDVHFGNVKMHKGELSIFDFDDSVLAWPIVDVAQSFFYVRNPGNTEPLEEAFWGTFGSDPASHGLTDREFDALVAGRSLLLVNDLLGNMTASLRAIAPTYVEKTRRRLSFFLKTGRFDTSLP